jgi:asparagine synthase (glutamine-hydrolysing)
MILKIAQKFPTSYKKLSFDFLLKRFTQGAEKSIPEAHFFWRHVLTPQEQKELLPKHSAFKNTDSFFIELFNQLGFDDDLNKLSLIDIKYFFVGDLMVKNDRTIMAHSIEARFPYVDRLLVEYINKIPTSLKVRKCGLERRYIQKRAMRNYLPKQIAKRNNMGLEMPHAIWFLDEFKPTAQKYFSKKNIEKTEILNFSAVNKLWEEHLSRRKDNGRPLWCILNFLVWFDLFVYNKDYKKYLS